MLLRFLLVGVGIPFSRKTIDDRIFHDPRSPGRVIAPPPGPEEGLLCCWDPEPRPRHFSYGRVPLPQPTSLSVESLQAKDLLVPPEVIEAVNDKQIWSFKPRPQYTHACTHAHMQAHTPACIRPSVLARALRTCPQ